MTVLGTVSQIDAGPLNVGYLDRGPVDGPAVVLLHGWPYDIHSYADVVPLLTAARHRVIVPYLRGFGTTRFLSGETVRNGEQAALALDTIALMDALGIETAVVAGFDWGARSADIVAALWPDRCRGLVSVSGYLIGSQAAGKLPLPPEAELQWWYQFYFATERGRAGYDKYRREFAKLIWQTASPRWDFDDATFERSAASFDNPDHVAIVIHNYRWRIGLAESEPEYAELEERLAAGPVITVPTITLEGDANGARILHPTPTPRSSPAATRAERSKEELGTTFPRKPRWRSRKRSPPSVPHADHLEVFLAGRQGRHGTIHGSRRNARASPEAVHSRPRRRTSSALGTGLCGRATSRRPHKTRDPTRMLTGAIAGSTYKTEPPREPTTTRNDER